MSEHAVIVKFKYGQRDLDPLHKLEDRLREVIESAGVGELDGHDIAIDRSDGHLYMYGPDAQRLFDTVKSTLNAASFLAEAVATLRFGPPDEGVPEREVRLGR